MKTPLCAFAVMTFLAAGFALAKKPLTLPTTTPAVTNREAMESQFAATLTNATLVGQYVTEGSGKPPKEDRYTILKAVKADGDNWVITAKIEYRGFALPVDLTVPVRWAGDTPVIQLTDYKVPGFGTFTARVMFFRDQYAGTWSAGNHGGMLWGKVERDRVKGATTQPVP